MFAVILIVASLVIALLGWNLYSRFGKDQIETLMQRRRNTSRFVSRGLFVDGSRHLDVALAVDQSTFFYENHDMAASIDLEWVREVEYDTKLATGAAMSAGEVLRLRSQSQTFEFVLPEDVAGRWHTVLPQRGEAHAV